jgi:pimeloyl-ACP methyl ester carboxylesterase
LVHYGIPGQRPAELKPVLEIFTHMNLRDYEVVCRAMGTVNLTSQLHEIASPTVVVVGANDNATPIAHAEVLAANIPHASLAIFDNANHLGIIEQPAKVYGFVECVLAAGEPAPVSSVSP